MASLSRQVKQASRLTCCYNKAPNIRLSSVQAAAGANVSHSRTGIEIPNKIERGPTDILKALASTVKTDPNAPHYKFIDDPWLIPRATREKRDYSLARASGKKAAQWMIGNYARHFEHDQAEPKIEAFDPHRYHKPRITEACEEGLQERINMRLPEEAFEMYTQLSEAGRLSELSQTLQEDLLTLLAWYGSTKPALRETLLPEEAFFRRELHDGGPRKLQLTWSQNNRAEIVFAALPEKTCSAYCSLIKGMSKHLEYEKPFTLLEEMKQKNMPVPVEVWNALITLAPKDRPQWDERVQAILSILGQMAASGVQPNLQTFNNALDQIRKLSRYNRTPVYIGAILQEMHKCRIEPSLGTWTSVLQFFYAKENSDSPIMLQRIMDQIEHKSLQLRDPADAQFFSAAMHRCQLHVKDIDLAWRIHRKLLESGNDQAMFLGEAYLEALYYNNLFQLLFSFDTLENVMQIYDTLVPHIWIPQWNTMQGLFDAIELQEQYDLLPRVWADLVLFNYWKRNELTGRLLQLMAKKDQPTELQAQLGDAVQTLLTKAEEDAERNPIYALQLDGSMMGDMILVLVRADRLSAAWTLFQRLCSKTGSHGGLASGESLFTLGDRCVKDNEFPLALRVLQLLCEMEYQEAKEFADNIKQNMELDADQLQEVELQL